MSESSGNSIADDISILLCNGILEKTEFFHSDVICKLKLLLFSYYKGQASNNSITNWK